MLFVRDLFPPIIKTLCWNVMCSFSCPWGFMILSCTGRERDGSLYGALGIGRSSWNDFSSHWVRMAGSLWNLTNSHPSLFTCHCVLLWVFLGKRADSPVTLVSERDWVTGLSALLLRNTQSKAQWQVNKEGCGFLVFASVSSLSASEAASGRACHRQRTGLTLGQLGDQSHVSVTALLSLPAACQKSLTGCQQLCSGPSDWTLPFGRIITSVWVIFQLVLNMAPFSHWHSILTSILLSWKRHSLSPCCLAHILCVTVFITSLSVLPFSSIPFFNEL